MVQRQRQKESVGACDTHVSEEKSLTQDFGWETWKQETTWKAYR